MKNKFADQTKRAMGEQKKNRKKMQTRRKSEVLAEIFQELSSRASVCMTRA